MISLSSSENNYNIVIAAGGLSDPNAFNRSTTTTNSSSSLQPTHPQTTSHLRQVRSLEKEYNPSICEEAQFVLPVPNISKIYGRSLDEILDKSKQQHADLGQSQTIRTVALGNLPITTTTSILSTASSGKRVPLIKTKNVDLNLVHSVGLPGASQVKSAPNSGESSPKGNLSFDSDVGDLAISDPGDYTTNYQSTQCTPAADSGNKEDGGEEDRKTPVSRRYYLTADNPSIKSSISLDDEMNLDDSSRAAEPYKLANIPSFLIEEEVSNKSTDDEADKSDRQQSIDLSEKGDKNDFNNNSLI